MEGCLPSWGRDLTTPVSFLHLFWEFRADLTLAKGPCLPSDSKHTEYFTSFLHWIALGGGNQKNILYLCFVLQNSLLTWLKGKNIEKENLKHIQHFCWEISCCFCKLAIEESSACGKVRGSGMRKGENYQRLDRDRTCQLMRNKLILPPSL